MLLTHTAFADARFRARVLLVDDHLPVLEQVSELLTPEFDIVGTATSGLQMIASALECRPDVIISDVSMPDVDGIEAARRLKSFQMNCAIVFLSINSDAEIVSTALAAGALGYVHKTRAGTELIPAIRQALQGRQFISPALQK
ncbi:MAG: response regulator transcription factor [Acidobacteriota bacterium]|nr:response regulator transcription factor [Acidobacteriota bacterium]